MRFTTTNFILQLNSCPRIPYVTSFLTRGWVRSLILLLAFSSAVILRAESRGAYYHILLCQIRDYPKLVGQVPVFISPRNGVALLYSQALGSLFVASYDSQGYGGGIPHMGVLCNCFHFCVFTGCICSAICRKVSVMFGI
jgi:hypothetical protein